MLCALRCADGYQIRCLVQFVDYTGDHNESWSYYYYCDSAMNHARKFFVKRRCIHFFYQSTHCKLYELILFWKRKQ